MKKWEAERLRRRERELVKYGQVMRETHGAPDDCQLLPIDCVMLEQSIRSAGNVPPGWIVSASRAWFAANNVGVDMMLPRPNR